MFKNFILFMVFAFAYQAHSEEIKGWFEFEDLNTNWPKLTIEVGTDKIIFQTTEGKKEDPDCNMNGELPILQFNAFEFNLELEYQMDVGADICAKDVPAELVNYPFLCRPLALVKDPRVVSNYPMTASELIGRMPVYDLPKQCNLTFPRPETNGTVFSKDLVCTIFVSKIIPTEKDMILYIPFDLDAETGESTPAEIGQFCSDKGLFNINQHKE